MIQPQKSFSKFGVHRNHLGVLVCFFLIECVGVILVNRIIDVSGIQAYSEIADSDSVILGVELRVCIPNQLPVDATTDAGPWLSF